MTAYSLSTIYIIDNLSPTCVLSIDHALYVHTHTGTRMYGYICDISMLQYAHRYAPMHASVIQRDTVLLLSSTAVAPIPLPLLLLLLLSNVQHRQIAVVVVALPRNACTVIFSRHK